MKANVYALVEHRPGASFDVWMLGGTQQELLDYYEKIKGKPVGEVERNVKEGFEHLFFDQDDNGGLAMVSQYVVGISEVIED